MATKKPRLSDKRGLKSYISQLRWLAPQLLKQPDRVFSTALDYSDRLQRSSKLQHRLQKTHRD